MLKTFYLFLIGLFSFGMSYLGAAVGLVLGHFRVALLTYALGSPAGAVATSLAISTVGSLAGAAAHARSGRVRLGPLALVGVPSAVAAYWAARYAGTVSPRALKLSIATTLLLAGVHLLIRAHRPPAAAVNEPRRPGGLARTVLAQIAVGTVLGAVSGLVGLLLGSLRLPAMLRLGGVDAVNAVGTNMAIGAITGLSGGLAAVVGGNVSPLAFFVVAPMTLLGAHLGAARTGTMDALTLTKWMGRVLVPTALLMFGDALWQR